MSVPIRDKTAVAGIGQTAFSKGLEDTELSLACQAISAALRDELRADERTRAVPIILLSARAGEDSTVSALASAGGTVGSRTCPCATARTASQPHLVDMTAKALQVLDKQTRYARKGFFLQIEGASIDKQDHAANPCGQIGENVEFDKADETPR